MFSILQLKLLYALGMSLPSTYNMDKFDYGSNDDGG